MNDFSLRRGANGVGFSIDLNEQRQKSRLMQEALQQHNMVRPRVIPRDPASIPEWVNTGDFTPAFDHEGRNYEARPPTYAPDRRAARFRDGYGPPPPLPEYEYDADGVPIGVSTRSRQARHVTLVPQEEFDRGVRHSSKYRVEASRGYRVNTANQQQYLPQPSPASPPPAAPPWQPPIAMPPLSTSDSAPPQPAYKKRKRRGRNKREARTSILVPPPPASSVSPTPYPNGLAVYPTPGREQAPTVCGHTLEVMLPVRIQGSWMQMRHTFSCELSPAEHPNQPHMLRLYPDSGSAFLGWYEDD